MRRRTVITGIGCITPLGTWPGPMWEGLTSGRCGVAPITVFDAAQFPVRIAAEVKNWSLADVGLAPESFKNAPRQTTFAIGAAILAAQSAGLSDRRINPRRFGISLGCGETFEDFPRFIHAVDSASTEPIPSHSRFAGPALRLFDPDAEREYEPYTAAARLSAMFGAEGPNHNYIAACVSAAQAIGEAGRLIRRGAADVMLAGGAHSTIHPFGVTGFHRLSALSTRNDDPAGAVRPFDRDRDGFVIGEGGAILVLEDLDHARRRGAPILAELTGYGSAQDAYRITDTHPEGRGTVAAARRALSDAALAPEAVDYVNAHGTGTPLNDVVETRALKQVFGAHAARVPISSTKSMLGHATTACGAIELAVCVLAMTDGVIPPTINLENPDPECDLDYVPRFAREVDCRHVMSTSIGFGGQNAALVVSRFDERARNVEVVRRAA